MFAKIFLSLALVFVAFSSTYGYAGVDLSVATTLDDWNCLVNQHNTTYAIIRAYRNVGALDTNSPNTLRNAYAAGVKDLGVYMFPCVQGSPYSQSKGIVCPEPEKQVLDTVKYLRENGIVLDRNLNKNTAGSDFLVANRLWLDIEDESPSKYYDPDPVKNQEFFARFVGQLEMLRIPVGIYTTKTYWQNVMGNILGYGKYPLWYSRYDGVDSFDFFVPFADFNECIMKQTAGDIGYCGISQVDPDYREVETI
jgi:GH25 family lysozyme M1 (1,4-beta-N-acetylmuramidase)